MTIPTYISFCVSPVKQQPEADVNDSTIAFVSEDRTRRCEKRVARLSGGRRLPSRRMSLRRGSLSAKKSGSQNALPSLPKRRSTIVLKNMSFGDDDDDINQFVAPTQEPERQTSDELPNLPKRRKTNIQNEPLAIQDCLDLSDIGSLADESVVEDGEEVRALETSYQQIWQTIDAERKGSHIPTPPVRRDSVVQTLQKDISEIQGEYDFVELNKGDCMFLSKAVLHNAEDTCEVLPPRQPHRKRSMLQAFASPKTRAHAMKTRSVQELQESMYTRSRVRGMRRIATAQPDSFANTTWH